MEYNDSFIKMTINRKWFDMILSGEKKEEYREIKPYWVSRLMAAKANYKQKLPHLRADYTIAKSGILVMRNGYSETDPVLVVECDRLSIGYPNPEWCPPNTDLNEKVFVLHLGNVWTDPNKYTAP